MIPVGDVAATFARKASRKAATLPPGYASTRKHPQNGENFGETHLQRRSKQHRITFIAISFINI